MNTVHREIIFLKYQCHLWKEDMCAASFIIGWDILQLKAATLEHILFTLCIVFLDCSKLSNEWPTLDLTYYFQFQSASALQINTVCVSTHFVTFYIIYDSI